MADGGASLRERLDRPRISVLGPVTITAGGVVRSLPGRPARALLGLVAAGRPLAFEHLADVVWPEGPPSTYRSALHVHLGSLRKALSEGAEIVRDGDSYVLRLDRWELDCRLAVDLMEDARAALSSDPARARDLVTKALSLWRGLPFAVDGEVVDAPASHQAEAARRDAEELLLDALIATNDAARAEGAALRFVAEEPLRETRWGQLLRARYLAGRTADALATYQEARATLVAELGIEPGRELADLEAAALTDDRSALRLPHASASERFRPPAASGAFIDRDVELRRIMERTARALPTVILGPPGVGKTRLALEAVRDVEDVAWIDARDPRHLDAAAEVLEWVRRHPEGTVVVDNVDLAMDALSALVADIRRHAPRVAVLVTSRAPMRIDASVEMLEPLESSNAAAALREALAELAPDAELSADDVARVCRRTGGLPLLIRLVAASARTLPVARLVERAGSVEGDEIDEAVRALLATLSERARRAFADLSVVDSFDLATAEHITELPADDLERTIVELVDHGLLLARPVSLRPYSMLEPIREVASRALDRSGRRGEVLDREVDATVARARAIARLASESEDGWQERLADELPRLGPVIERMRANGDADRALSLVSWLEVPLYALGWWEEKIDLFDRALSIPGERTATRARAHAFRARPGPLHRFDTEHAEAAEAIATELGHDLLLAFARHVRGIGLWWSGQSRLAMPLFADAADRFAAAGRLIEECDARRFLAMSMIFEGDVDGGLDLAHDALGQLRCADGMTFHIGHHLAYLGHCHRMLGDDVAARADLLEARAMFSSIGNRGSAIHVEIGLGDLAVDRGDSPEALAATATALDMMRRSRGWTYAPWAWTVAMRAHAGDGELDAALMCARRALVDLARVPSGEAVRLAGALARVALQRGDVEVAARLLSVARSTDDARELPFVPLAERRRLDDLEHELGERLGGRPAVAPNRRLSITEAAGSLLA